MEKGPAIAVTGRPDLQDRRGAACSAMEQTRATLLQRLRQPDAGAAWEQFCLLYGGPILRYAGKLGLNNADAQDVMQETLVALVRQMPRFEYDPARGRFRNFVLTIVHRQAMALLRRRGRRPETPLPPGLEALPATISPQDDDRWEEALFDEAWTRLRRSGALQPKTVAAFEDYALRSLPADQVAKKYDLTANTVYQIRSRVIAMLKQEVEQLVRELDPGEGT